MSTNTALTYLKLQVNFFRHFLFVRLQQLNGLLQWLKHLIGGCLAVLHGRQMFHALDETVIVSFIYRIGQTFVRDLDEVSKLLQAGKKRKRLELKDSWQGEKYLYILLETSNIYCKSEYFHMPMFANL